MNGERNKLHTVFRENLVEYFINPGQLIFSKKSIIASTVLGSCVSVCIHDSINRWGGMCHYLLPEAPTDEKKSTRYGTTAIYTLLHKFYENGSKREQLCASIIGGAFIVYDEREFFFVGDKNIDLAFDILKKERIRIYLTNTGGEYGRKLYFATASNTIFVKDFAHITIDDLYNPDL